MSFIGSWFGGGERGSPKLRALTQVGKVEAAAAVQSGEDEVGKKRKKRTQGTRTQFGGLLADQAQTSRKTLLGG